MIKIDIKNNGFHLFKENIFEINDVIIDEFKEIYQKNLDVRIKEKVAMINDLDGLKKFENIKKVFNQIIKILEFNNFNDIKFDDVWFVNSDKNIYQKDKLPYVPHIDKKRKLKVMIYLNEVELENGPIHFVKINPNKYENFRKKLGKNYKEKQENEIKDIQIEKYEPLTGKFGTTIFFDTNAPHFAGKIENVSAERKVIRFNFSFNEKKSFFKNFFSI
jgi:hypothetical protein